MRILFLSSWYPYPPDNGARLRVYNLIRQLAKKHDIVLLAFVREERPQPQDTPLVTYCQEVRTLPFPMVQKGKLQALRGLLSSQPRALLSSYSAQMEVLIQGTLSKGAFDVIIASENGVGILMVPYISGREGVPCIVEDLELSMILSKVRAQDTQTGRWRHGLTWWKLRRYASHMLRRMAGCTVVSTGDLQLVQQIARANLPLAVVPNGVEMGDYAGDWGDVEPRSLIFSGALSYEANLEAMQFFLSGIWPSIRSRCPEAVLRITGSTSGLPLEALPEEPGVSLTGYLEDIRPAIARSWVSVVPLRQGGGSRLKILEAMALGTPVVSTTKGAEGIEAVHREDILIADEPKEFADAVVALLEDPALRANLSASGRRLVGARYSWEVSAQALEQLLHRVVQQGQVRG